MKLKLATIFALFIWFISSAKPVDDRNKIIEIFKKTTNFYENNSAFQTDLNYTLYPTATATKAIEKYSGFMIKKKDNYYVKIDKTEFIANKERYIKIDNKNKRMLCQGMTQNRLPDLFYDTKKYLKNFSNFSLTSSKTQWICTMLTPAVTFIPYSKVVIVVDKEDYSISKELLFLIMKNKYKTPRGEFKNDYPRIEIDIKKNILNSKNDHLLDINNYINLKKGNNYPIGIYKTYKMVNN